MGSATSILLDSGLLGLDAVLLGSKRDGDDTVLLDDTDIRSPVGEPGELVGVLSSPARSRRNRQSESSEVQIPQFDVQ